MHANGTFSCAWRQRDWYLNNILGWKTVIPRLASVVYRSLPRSQLVKSTIVQYVFRTLTLWNSLFCYCHEWLRPDLKIRSNNKHRTGKADEIFTEIWRDSFSPCGNSAEIPLESHEIPEGGSHIYSFLMVSYIRLLWMKIDNYRQWTVEIEIKLQHHQLVQNLVQSFWHGKQLMKTSSIRSNIFQKSFATGALPQTPLRWPKSHRSPIADCRLHRTATVDVSIRLEWALLIAAPHEKKWNKKVYTKSNIIGYQYSPKAYSLFLSWHAKYFVTPKV